MATSALADVRAGLVSDITAQLVTDGVSGVKVRAFPPTSNDWDRSDIVYLSDAGPIAQEHLTYGGSRIEEISLTGFVWAFKSGGTEDEAIEAEARSLDIFGSVENSLRTDHQVNSTVFHAQIADYTVRPGPDDQGYVSQVEFTIDIEAHI